MLAPKGYVSQLRTSMADQATLQEKEINKKSGKIKRGKVSRFRTESDYSSNEYDALSKMYEGTLGRISENEIIKGRIVQITDDDVSIDIGFKSEGVVPRNEFTNIDDLKPGDEVEVFLEKVEDAEGKLVLSRRRADFMRVWEQIGRAYENQEVLKATITRRIKGGLVVDLLGLDAFLPGSQVDVRPVRDFDALIGRELDVRVVKINHPNENVVVSHKVLLEENLAEQRSEILAKLEKGLVLEGTVKAITDFGVFVDLGGVDGLVHITDLSWGRVNHPSEVVKLDETIKVVVLDFDEERRRISLGLKQLTPHPWENIEEKIHLGNRVTGKVVSLTDYGAFVELERGIEGLIHISEMSWTQHIKHPSQMVSLGQMVEVQVLNIDKNDKKISLGMKQLEPDPWDALLEKYPVGSSHTGIVRNLANFGVFVELEPGVDGLVHISDLSWTKKLRHPGEMVKKGQELEVTVLGIDREQRRISLGHKQIVDNPWEAFAESYSVGKNTEGKIVRIIDKGVIVELPYGVDGFVPTSQLAFAPVKNIASYFRIGDRLPLQVIEFDKEAKKIVLSAVEALREMGPEAQEDYYRLHPVPQSGPAGMSHEEIPVETHADGDDEQAEEPAAEA
jgi:small subunit ribosomal protein S1